MNEFKFSYQGSVATDEVVHGLSQVKLAHRGEHTKCITGQKNDILRLRTDARNLSIRNVLNRVGCTGVLCNMKKKKFTTQMYYLETNFLVLSRL